MTMMYWDKSSEGCQRTVEEGKDFKDKSLIWLLAFREIKFPPCNLCDCGFVAQRQGTALPRFETGEAVLLRSF